MVVPVLGELGAAFFVDIVVIIFTDSRYSGQCALIIHARAHIPLQSEILRPS